MNIRAVTFLLACGSLAALCAWPFMARWEQTRERELNADHQTRLAMQARDWARDDAARKVAAQQAALKRGRERQRELEAAWGGPTEAPAKNPALDIRQMLEQTARACAPPGAVVTVRADRFTEFEATFELKRFLSERELAGVSICLLQHGVPYLRSVRFIQGGYLLAELDDRAIDSVVDWSKASAVEVENLLIVPEATRVSTANAGNAPSPGSTGDRETELTGDRKRLREVETSFNNRLQEQFKFLTALLETQDAAANLGGLQSGTDLQARLKVLEANDAALASARGLLLNQGQEYRRALEELKLDPLLVKVVMRAFTEREDQERVYLTELLDGLAERQRSVKALLTNMQSVWGSWSADPSANSIQFTSLAARDTYNQSSSQLQRSTERVSAAMRAWTAWKAAQKRGN